MYAATLSIDLGASYTKVAYRRGYAPDSEGRFDSDAEVLVIDGSPLIPSLGIFTGNKERPWFFGRTAAGMTPSPEMRRFVNWKSNLFRPSNDELSIEAAIVAGNFFSWLRGKIEATGRDVKDAEARVAMPAFANFHDKAAMVAKCMELNGWNSPKILKATEPHANALGLFSNGRNVIGTNHVPQYNKIFGQNIYVRTARNAIFTGSNPLVAALIVDIGAFTTDIAALTFDTRSEHDGLANIDQESYALGVINELDEPLFKSISERHGFSWSALSFDESETAKRSIYRGASYSLLPPHPAKQVGGTTDADLVTKHTTGFADQVWDKVKCFIQRSRPSTVFLTGGGTLISSVAEALKARFVEARVPMAAIEPATNSGNGDWRAWVGTGESLARLATAVGGASVILQDSGEFKGNRPIQPIRFPQPVDDYAECRFCHGRNKDCCYCGGRGYYRKR